MHKMDFEQRLSGNLRGIAHGHEKREANDRNNSFSPLKNSKGTKKKKERRSTCYTRKSKSHDMQVAGRAIAKYTGHRKEIFFSNSQGGVSAKTAS